jgi:hypothetical protein
MVEDAALEAQGHARSVRRTRERGRQRFFFGAGAEDFEGLACEDAPPFGVPFDAPFEAPAWTMLPTPRPMRDAWVARDSMRRFSASEAEDLAEDFAVVPDEESAADFDEDAVSVGAGVRGSDFGSDFPAAALPSVLPPDFPSDFPSDFPADASPDFPSGDPSDAFLSASAPER